MSFTKIQRKQKREKKRCYRCPSTKQVRTYGNNDWCVRCKKEIEGQRNDGSKLVADPRGHVPHQTKRVARVPVVSDAQLDLIQPQPCKPTVEYEANAIKTKTKSTWVDGLRRFSE